MPSGFRGFFAKIVLLKTGTSVRLEFSAVRFEIARRSSQSDFTRLERAQARSIEIDSRAFSRRKCTEPSSPVISVTPDFCEDYALEYDDELASLCRSKVRVLFANIILNPFGPTFIMVFAKEDELTPGGVATLYQASLHPSTPEFREIGTIGLPLDWAGSFTEVNCDELAEGLGGASVGFIVPPAWMEDEIRLGIRRPCKECKNCR